MQVLELDIIGTHLHIQIDTSSSCDEDFSHIRSYLTDFELRYSRFIDDNWLAHINKNRTGILDENGKIMLEFMLEMAHKTGGYFDPTIGKRLTELGYGNTKIILPEAKGEIGYGDYRDIEVTGSQVVLHGNSILEFGGVGKGYLIDVIVGMLESWNVRILEDTKVQPNTPTLQHSNFRFLINFGGDIYGKGGWTIGLESPFSSDEIIGTITLEDHYLASSAGTRRKWGSHHHLIDPHTGESSRDVISSYIEGQSGMVSDAYATTLCVMPWELACTVLENTPQITGVIVRHDGSLYQKQGSRSEIFQ